MIYLYFKDIYIFEIVPIKKSMQLGKVIESRFVENIDPKTTSPNCEKKIFLGINGTP